MASQIDIISNAFLLIGTPTINSLTDGTTRANVAAALYDTTVDSLLTMNRWRFAHATLELSQISGEPASDIYRYAYQLPADYLMAVKVEPHSDRYDILGDQLWSNISANLRLTYINRPDESKFPQYFVKCLEYRLAVEFCVPITESRTLKETLKEDYKMVLHQAMWADAQGRPPTQTQNSPIHDCRL